MLPPRDTTLPKTLDDLTPGDLCARLDRLDLISRKVFAGKLAGERRSKRRGRSVEFEDYRSYIPGDDLRHIDWNVMARLDRLVVKIFQEEEDLALHLVVDVSGSMNAGNPNKLIVAQQLAMALGYVGLVGRNRVSASVTGNGFIKHLAPTRGRRAIQRLANFLIDHTREAVRHPTGTDTFRDAMRSVAAARTGRGVIVLLSDFLQPDGSEDGLRLLASRRDHDVFCLQILAPGELDPASERTPDGTPVLIGDLRLTDLETGRTQEVTATRAVLDRYRADMRQEIEQLASFCRARSMHHRLITSDADPQEILLQEFRRDGMLR